MAKIKLPKTQSPSAVKKADEKNLDIESAEKLPVWLPDFRAGHVKGPLGSDVKGWADLTASNRNKWRIAAGLPAWREAHLSTSLQGARPGVNAMAKFLYLWHNLIGFEIRKAWANLGLSNMPNRIQAPVWQVTPNDAPPISEAFQRSVYSNGVAEDSDIMGDAHRVVSGWLWQAHVTGEWNQIPNGEGGGIVQALSGVNNPEAALYTMPFIGQKAAWDVFIWWSDSTWPQYGQRHFDGGRIPPAGMTAEQMVKEQARFAGMMTTFESWPVKPDPMAVMVNPTDQQVQGCPWNPDGYDVRVGNEGPSHNVFWGYQAPWPSKCIKGQMGYDPSTPLNPGGYHSTGRVNLARVVIQHRATGFWFVDDRVPAVPVGIITVAESGAGHIIQAIGPST